MCFCAVWREDWGDALPGVRGVTAVLPQPGVYRYPSNLRPRQGLRLRRDARKLRENHNHTSPQCLSGEQLFSLSPLSHFFSSSSLSLPSHTPTLIPSSPSLSISLLSLTLLSLSLCPLLQEILPIEIREVREKEAEMRRHKKTIQEKEEVIQVLEKRIDELNTQISTMQATSKPGKGKSPGSSTSPPAQPNGQSDGTQVGTIWGNPGTYLSSSQILTPLVHNADANTSLCNEKLLILKM